MHHTHANEPASSLPRASKRGRKGRLAKWGRIAAASAVAAASLGPVAAPALAAGHGQPTTYKFETLDNTRDLTFNQLLGINNKGLIAGYFGSGAQGHPNKGYLLSAPYGQGNYANENFPGSVQTQVAGLNDSGVTVGFWSTMNNANQVNDNFGFYKTRGRFYKVDSPLTAPATSTTQPVNQLLGVNDSDIAVGFYNDANQNAHGYTYNIHTKKFHYITISGASSLTAAAINNHNDIAGFETQGTLVEGFLRKGNGKLTTLALPGATMTQALGVNDSDEVVGVYTVGSGSSAVMHGFTWTAGSGFQTVDDPHGVGTTTINGVNNKGQLVGFYVDSAGNTDGLLATPAHH